MEAFTRLWLVPGLVIFALCFLPWMLAVAARHPHAWDLWDWQYVQRAEGDYIDSRERGLFYYVPRILGLAIPWLFLLPEALAAPWLTRYRMWRRPLLYCGLWAAVGIVIMSLESFKRSYYVLPAMPGLILMMSVVADRFYARRPASVRLAWIVWCAAAVALAIGLVIGDRELPRYLPEATSTIMTISIAAAVLLLLAGIAYVRGRGWFALGMTAVTAVAAFHSVWYLSGAVVADMDKVAGMARALSTAGVPPEANVLWADTRPDCRLSFYFGRRSGYMIKPAEIVTVMTERRTGRNQLVQMALERAGELLQSTQPVYLILSRRNYDRMRTYSELRAVVVDSVHEPNHAARDDWMIISNVAPRGS